ncbi:aromatase/cyclase [Streptomyces sp. NPDC048182]|uniref:aromatase/cyclase n=1 Tax=unclassified Streptomyces TaxID=2593676 RepID=UPI0033BB9601
MSADGTKRSTKRIRVSAPAGVVYALLADAENWPLFFSPSVHVETLDAEGERQRMLMWSLLGGRLTSWISWRRLDPVHHRMEFRQELPAAPLHSMGGLVQIHERGPGACEIELGYDLTTAGPPGGQRARAERAVDLNTTAQLDGLKTVAERWPRLDDLMLTFEDSLHVDGPAELVYDFLYRAGDWPELVPHITRVDLTEDTPGVQHLSTQTRTEYGTRTLTSVRVCFPHAERVVYKETTPSPLLAAHVGEWSVVPDGRGVTVTARHSALLREEHLAAELGEHATLAAARRHVREEIGRNARVLLAHARTHAENGVRML